MQRNVSASASTNSLHVQALRSQLSTMTPPLLQRTMTAPVDSTSLSATSGAPSAATNSIFNKPTSISLYQTCRSIIDRLKTVPKFEELYLHDSSSNGSVNAAIDPVSELWKCFRLGASLCHLYNTTMPDIELSVRPDATITNLNACKAEVYHFLLACKKHLNFGDEALFTISELYSENTNGFVKVTRTVEMVLDLLQARQLLIIRDDQGAESLDQEAPKDNRTKVIAELLETERKYVQYLEMLQNYMRELQSGEIISADTSHMLFANLNALVDFQRRFLIGIETTCALPSDQQRIGLVFCNLEEAFVVYEPFCANYTYAAELAIEETPKLKRLEHLVEPTYELPSLLIKPIQRICKYPLLLRELIRYTSETDSHYQELLLGEAAIKRVTDRVNETRRRQENEVIVMELERRIEDWKGHSVASFGALLLEDTFQVAKSDVEREYRVYLFERILLCCKESKENKKNSKSMSISKKPKKRSSLQLKGRIFINNVTDTIPASRGNLHTLQVYWKGDQDQEFFTLRCRNEENLRQWHTALVKLLEEVRNMTEYSNYQGQAARTVSSTSLGMNQQSQMPYREINNYDSDEESHRTEETLDDIDSQNGSSVSMSREQSSNSMRSRSTTNESISAIGHGRYHNPPLKALSNGMPRHLQGEPYMSHFSPALDSESPYGSRAGSTAANGYPFPRTSFHEEALATTGATRNTAPPMSRATSRDGPILRPMYAVPNGRGSSSSLIQRPGMNSRTRSASTPTINSQPRGLNVHIPEMPPPKLLSAQSSASPASATSSDVQHSASAATKCKICYGDDIFVIMIPLNISYRALLERVEKKLRICGHNTGEPGNLRIRYQDEDEDLITINSDEDILLALEGSIEDPSYFLTLYATTNIK